MVENYKSEIGALNSQIKEMKSSIESEKNSFKTDLDISLRAIENDFKSRNDQLNTELDSLRSLNQQYVDEIGNLKQSLSDYDSEIESLRYNENIYRQQIETLQAKLDKNDECVRANDQQAAELIDFGDLDGSKIVVKNGQDEMLIECLEGGEGGHEEAEAGPKMESTIEAEYHPKENAGLNQMASCSSFTSSYTVNKSLNENDVTADDADMAAQQKLILAAMSGEIDTSLNLDEQETTELEATNNSNVTGEHRLNSITLDITVDTNEQREQVDMLLKYEELVKELYKQIEEQKEEIIQLKLRQDDNTSDQLVKQLYQHIESQREEIIQMKLEQNDTEGSQAIAELEARLNEISNYKEKYLELKEGKYHFQVPSWYHKL